MSLFTDEYVCWKSLGTTGKKPATKLVTIARFQDARLIYKSSLFSNTPAMNWKLKTQHYVHKNQKSEKLGYKSNKTWPHVRSIWEKKNKTCSGKKSKI